MCKVNWKELNSGGGYQIRYKNRDSSIELFRILTMLCIVAHHYVVNSGIIEEITPMNTLKINSLFALLFGWAGKTGINCFVLITGYFMCKSSITLKKFLRLFLEIEFYKIAFYLIFLITGYSSFSIKELIKAFLPIYGIGSGFTSSYLVFFLFIPYLNLLIKAMNERQHLVLVGLCLLVDTILQTFLKASEAFTYVGWFMTLYFIASYIRLYPDAGQIRTLFGGKYISYKLFENKKLWGWLTVICLALSWCSVIAGAYIYHVTGKEVYHYFVSDSNKLFAVSTAICAFLFFKNIGLSYQPIINRIAASTFGVLMIHANSDTMRQWLWRDMLNNSGAYHSNYFAVHAVCSVAVVYIVCTLIDMIRIKLSERFL